LDGGFGRRKARQKRFAGSNDDRRLVFGGECVDGILPGEKGDLYDLYREMYFLEYSRKIRAAVQLPLAYLGGIKSLANAQQAVAEGFDCVVLARALLRDPSLVNKLQSGEMTQSRCDNCNGCVAYIYHPAGTRCVYNPPNDLTLNRTPASQPIAASRDDPAPAPARAAGQ